MLSRFALHTSTAAVTAGMLVTGLAAAPAEAATTKVKIVKVQYDSPGSDRGSNASRNNEWVQIQNIGRTPKQITGFTLADETGYTYTFKTNTLQPGQTVKVRSGHGDNTRRNKYWDAKYYGRPWYVWNNDGDKATLRDGSGDFVDSCKWGAGNGVRDCYPD